jgi:hypothetical protein
LKTQSSGFRPPQDPSSLRVVARSISADRSLRRRTSLQVHASETNTTKGLEQKGQASTQQTRACMHLPAPHSRPPQAPSRRRPQHQRRPPFTTRKPASACVKKQHNTTQRREQKGRGKNTIENAVKRLPAAARPVESSSRRPQHQR